MRWIRAIGAFVCFFLLLQLGNVMIALAIICLWPKSVEVLPYGQVFVTSGTLGVLGGGYWAKRKLIEHSNLPAAEKEQRLLHHEIVGEAAIRYFMKMKSDVD